MKKFKNWLKNHYKIINTVLSITLTICVFILGIKVGFDCSERSVSASPLVGSMTSEYQSITPLRSLSTSFGDYNVYFDPNEHITADESYMFPMTSFLASTVYYAEPDYYCIGIQNPLTGYYRYMSASLQYDVKTADYVGYLGGNVEVQSAYYFGTVFETPNLSPSVFLLEFDPMYVVTNDTASYPLWVTVYDYVNNIPVAFHITCEYFNANTATFTEFSYTGYDELGVINVFDHIILPASQNDLTYQYIRNLKISIYCAIAPRTVTEIQINEYYSSNVGYYASVFNSETYDITYEIVEYKVNVFQSIVQTVDDFLSIELIPGFSFYTLLLICVAIPLFIAVLKIYLGG